jgi:hypothetical protein
MNAEERKEKENALQRYEEARRNQLGGAISLMFGLATAATGFCISQIVSKDSSFSSPGSYWFVSATCVFALTVTVCVAATWTRLRDFRLTAKTVRRELDGATTPEIEKLRTITRRLGDWTWILFYAQLIAFFLGVALLGVSLVLLYSSHLFPTSTAKTPSEHHIAGNPSPS